MSKPEGVHEIFTDMLELVTGTSVYTSDMDRSGSKEAMLATRGIYNTGNGCEPIQWLGLLS